MITISGGGREAGRENRIGAHFATIGGGVGNWAHGESATVAGGFDNRILATARSATSSGGESNTVDEDDAVVGGGRENRAGAISSSIGGGRENLIGPGAYNATIGGGIGNTNLGWESVIAGGYGNAVTGPYNAVGSGQGNRTESIGSAVAGGDSNHAQASYSAIGGGHANTASGYAAVIAGGGGQDEGGKIRWATRHPVIGAALVEAPGIACRLPTPRLAAEAETRRVGMAPRWQPAAVSISTLRAPRHDGARSAAAFRIPFPTTQTGRSLGAASATESGPELSMRRFVAAAATAWPVRTRPSAEGKTTRSPPTRPGPPSVEVRFVLDETLAIASPPAAISWLQVPFPYQTNTTHISITVPMPSGNKFYRLRKP